MKVSLHIRSSAVRKSQRCDEIVKLLSDAGTETWITEDSAPDVQSDVDLVFADDLERHLAGGPIPSTRTVLLQPSRDEIFELAERYGFPAVIFYVQFDAWNLARNNLIVRRELAGSLGGTLGPATPFGMMSENYAAWMDAEQTSLALRLSRFLYALPRPPVVVSGEQAAQRGLPAITIRVERTTGLSARPFPIADAYFAMNGPPGGPLSVFLWNSSGLPTDDAGAAISARVQPVVPNIQLGNTENVHVMGRERTVMTFRTGDEGRWTSWVGFIVSAHHGSILVTMGAGSGNRWSTASEVLSNRFLRNAAATLTIE